jgi:hypothetical protein
MVVAWRRATTLPASARRSALWPTAWSTAGSTRPCRARRERAADDLLNASDGRSGPPGGPDVRAATTEYAPSRRFARRHQPDVVELTQPGATDRGYQTNRVLQRQHTQRYTPPRVEQEDWAQRDESGEAYRHDAAFENNWQTTWERSRGPAHAGNPVAFEVRRVSR